MIIEMFDFFTCFLIYYFFCFVTNPHVFGRAKCEGLCWPFSLLIGHTYRYQRMNEESLRPQVRADGSSLEGASSSPPSPERLVMTHGRRTIEGSLNEHDQTRGSLARW